jgi:hypothetical protein
VEPAASRFALTSATSGADDVLDLILTSSPSIRAPRFRQPSLEARVCSSDGIGHVL